MLSRTIFNTASALQTGFDRNEDISVLSQKQVLELMWHWHQMAVLLEQENEELKRRHDQVMGPRLAVDNSACIPVKTGKGGAA